MPIEDLLFGQATPPTTYSARQLREKLARLRAGIADAFPAQRPLIFIAGAKRSKARVLKAIDAELAAFAAFEALLVTVKSRRLALKGRLPLMAKGIELLSASLSTSVGRDAGLRRALGLAPNKKPRRLKPEERMAATLKLRATRKRNGTAARKPRRR